MHKKLITALTLSAMALPLANTGTFVLAEATNSGMNSNATLKITKDDNEASLILRQVPSFNFGNVEAGIILGGGNVEKSDANQKIIISDQRARQADWTLSVNGSALASSSNTISGANLNITQSGGGLSITNILLITGGAKSSYTQVGGGNYDQPVNGQLVFPANTNSNLNLNQEEEFTSKLTWTLTALPPARAGL